MKKVLFSLFFVLFLLGCEQKDQPDYSKQIPPLSGHMNDHADLFEQATRDSVERELTRFEEKTSNQVVVLTVPSIGEKTIETYSYDVASAWKLGQKDRNNGILITVAEEQKKVRIEVGYGLEGPLPDGRCWYIIENCFLSEVKGKSKDFDKAILQTINAIELSIAGEFSAVEKQVDDNNKTTWFVILLVVAGLLAGFFGGVAESAVVGATIGGISYPLIWIALWPPDTLILLGLILLGAVIGAIARFVAEGISESSGGSGGYYYGGSSGSSGGFSGGGGSFGGGGCSGGW